MSLAYDRTNKSDWTHKTYRTNKTNRSYLTYWINTMKKHSCSECFFIVCIISRILSWIVIYLGLQLLADSSGTPRRTTLRFLLNFKFKILNLTFGCTEPNVVRPDTALHWGKDFAVSPRHRCRATLLNCFKRVLWLSPLASLLAPLGLLQTGITRYLLPLLIAQRGLNVRTFLQSSSLAQATPATISYTPILYNFNTYFASIFYITCLYLFTKNIGVLVRMAYNKVYIKLLIYWDKILWKNLIFRHHQVV